MHFFLQNLDLCDYFMRANEQVLRSVPLLLGQTATPFSSIITTYE